MIYVGIDVAKEKHDCFAMNSDGEILFEKFTIKNNLEGFNSFYQTLLNFSNSLDNIKVGLEATGHYSNNILHFLVTKGFHIFLINPLQTTLFRKSQSLRKTKTDKLDAHLIATMLITENLKPYSPLSYHISELKSLTRHRFRLLQERSRFKISLSRLITIVFPELSDFFSSTSQKTVLALLSELPNAQAISTCNLTKLTNILSKASRGKIGKDKSIELRELARNSIGSNSIAVSLELKQVIQVISFLQEQIDNIDAQIKDFVITLDTPILTIPGISYLSAANILAEIGDINNFDSSAKVLAFAGLDPSTYQSGKFTATHAKMVKRGSKYLRYHLMSITRTVCMNDSKFNDFKNKKLAEGKHYFVALSHVTKKLVRVIFYLLKSNSTYDASKLV